MGIEAIFRLFATREGQAPGPTDDFWYEALGTMSATGVKVTPETARRCAAVYAAVRVLSDTLAQLPLMLYKRNGDGRERDTNHPLFKLLYIKPNRWQTSLEFREMMMGHVLLRGNAYAQKVYDMKSGAVKELVPLNPTKVSPKLTEWGDPFYEFQSNRGGTIILQASDVFHLKGPSDDGLVGLSPIAVAAEPVGLALAAEEFGARTFKNDAQPGGVLEHPGTLDEEAVERLRSSWAKQHSGVTNARKPVVLEEGMKWTRVGMSADDTQFLETRRFQVEDIARIFRVPPHLIGHLDKATFSNIEHQALEFVTHTMNPWIVRWEQAIGARLLDETEQVTHYVKFIVEGLLRGDIASRYNAYSIARQWGWMSVNEIRKLEDLDSIGDSGNTYLVPMNMVDADRLDEVIDSQIEGKTASPAVDPSSTPPEQANNNQSGRGLVAIDAFKPVLADMIQRYSERIKKSKKPMADHESVISEGLKPAVAGLFMLSNDRDPDIQSDIAIRSFIKRWSGAPESTQDELLGELIRIVAHVNEIRVVTIKETNNFPDIVVHNAAPVVNVTVPPPASTTRSVEWITDAGGKRKALIHEVPK